MKESRLRSYEDQLSILYQRFHDEALNQKKWRRRLKMDTLERIFESNRQEVLFVLRELVKEAQMEQIKSEYENPLRDKKETIQ